MALQRFVWEFFKPYATVIGPFNLFHVVCLGLVLYAAVMIRSGGRDVRWHSAQVRALSLPRPDHLVVRDLPRPGAGQDRRGGRRHLLFQALPRARRDEDPGVGRSGLLAAHAGIPEARRPPAWRRTPAPSAAARGIAASAPTTSSIPAWPSSRSTRPATSPARSASPIPRPSGTRTAAWPRSSACSTPWWRAKASPTWCRSRAASPPSIRRSSRSSPRRGAGRSST